MAKPLTSHRPGLGITLRVLAILLFTIMAALVKAVSDQVPAGQAVFFRAFFAIPVTLGWLALRGELRQGLTTRNPRLHVIRGIVGTSAMVLTFAGLGLLPLPEVTAIGFATPIFTVILAVILLGERIRLVRISAVLMGLVGVVIVIWPRLGSGVSTMDAAALGAGLILVATLLRALVQIHLRKMVATEHPATIAFYFSLTAAILALMSAPFGWVWPAPWVITLMVLSGLIGGVAQILITSSFRFGPASMLAPYDYSSMLFSILIGYVWFDEVPTWMMLGGALLVILGNGLVVWRERQLQRRKPA